MSIKDVFSTSLFDFDRPFDLLFLLIQAPKILNSRLFSFPALSIESRPDSSDEEEDVVPHSVDGRKVGVEPELAFLIVEVCIDEMPDEEDQTQNRQGSQPRHVVDEES